MTQDAPDGSGGREVLSEGERRARFAGIFASEDPWRFTTSVYERERHRRTLELVPPCVLALEIGCAEGVFTRMLASRAARIVAFDLGATALARARVRCADLAHVEFVQADLVSVEFRAGFEAVVATEVLGYLAQPQLPALVKKMAGWLSSYGVLISTPPYGTLTEWLAMLQATCLEVIRKQHVNRDEQECWVLAARRRR